MSNLNVTPGWRRLSGRQALVWTDDSHVGTSREHVLRVPLQRIRPAIRTRTKSVDSWDYSSRTTFTSSNRAHELVAEIRHDRQGESLIQMIAAGMEGQTITFYPDIEDATRSYDVDLIEPTGPQAEAALGEHTGLWGEWDGTVRFRKTDGTEFGPEIFTGMLFQYLPGQSLRRATFSRGSTAHYDALDATLTEAASGEARDAHYVTDENGELVRAIKLEAARTNELHNSDSPATQTRSLTAGTYTLWMDGTGSVNADGATDGDYGTATEGQANDVTFTVTTTQDVTFTVSGSVDRFQCEEGSFRSSFIETAGSSVSRAADDLSTGINFGPQELTVYHKGVIRRIQNSGSFTVVWFIGDGLGGTRFGYHVEDTGGLNLQWQKDTFRGVTLSPSYSVGDTVEVRCVLEDDGTVLIGASINGASEATASGSGDAPSGSWNADKLSLGRRPGGDVGFYDHTAVLVAPGVRTMSECRNLVG